MRKIILFLIIVLCLTGCSYFKIKPEEPEQNKITVEIYAKDLDGNELNEEYSFSEIRRCS